MLKKIMLLFFVLFCFISFCSCERYGTEIEDMMIIQGVAVDKENDKFSVTVEMLNNDLTSLKSVPVGLIKESLKPYLYNFKADKATIISSNALENCKNVVSSLLTQHKKLGNALTILIDTEEVFAEYKPLASSYCFEKIEEFTDQIIQFIDQKIVNSQYDLTIFIGGVDKFKESLSSTKLDEFMNKIKSVANCNLIFIDSAFKLKKLAFELWYTSMVVNSNGIWIGSGVMEQTVIKPAEYNKKYNVQISNGFAWIFKNGSGQLTKLIGGEETNEE